MVGTYRWVGLHRGMTAALCLVSLAACSSNQNDGADGLVGQTPQALIRMPRISEELSARLSSKTSSIRVALSIPEPALPDQVFTESGSASFGPGAEVTDGEQNGAPAGKDDFARSVETFRRELYQRELERVEVRKGVWRRIATKYGISNAVFDAAIRDGTSSLDVLLPSPTVASLSRDTGGLVAGLDVQPDGDPNVSLANTLATMQVSTVGFPAGYDGTGQAIFLIDQGTPISGADCVDPTHLELYGATGTAYDHATEMIGFAQAAAPGAIVVYGTYSGADGATIPTPLLSHSPPINVSSQSRSYQYYGHYTNGDQAFDNSVLSTRIARFNSVGNGDHASDNVTSPSIAYNVIGVGGYDTVSNTVLPYESSVDSSATHSAKPEIVAPGADIALSNTYPSVNGTSPATALAAGFAADLMREYSFLRLRPALLKAYLMVNGVRVDSDGVIYGDRDGTGSLSFANVRYGAAYWWEGSNSAFFTSDSDGDLKNDITVSRTLSSGTYYAVISWLVDGDYVYSANVPNMDLDLYVTSPDGTVWYSASSDQSFEAVKFVASQSGSYNFRIERYGNSGGGPISLGLVVRAR